MGLRGRTSDGIAGNGGKEDVFQKWDQFLTISFKKFKNTSKSPKIEGETEKWVGPLFVNKYKLTMRRPVIVR